MTRNRSIISVTLTTLALACISALALAQPAEPAPTGADRDAAQPNTPRFVAVDITIDPGEHALAAWQAELRITSPDGPVRLVGVEGGEHPAFTTPPHYDPAALHESHDLDRIILAALSTDADLPTEATRTARVHLMLPSAADPVITTTNTTAGDPAAARIDAAFQTSLVTPQGVAP